jgi:hypothetical protein
VDDNETPLGTIDIGEDPIPQGAVDPADMEFDMDSEGIPMGVLGVPQTGGEGPIDGAVKDLTGMGMILSAEMAAILAVMKKKKDEQDEESSK